MTDDQKRIHYGEMLSGSSGSDGGGDGDLSLRLPPSIKGMTMGQAILGQLPYWGAKRTIDAYRRVLQSGVETLGVQRDFYKAVRVTDSEKERWKNQDVYREGVKEEATTYLETMVEQRNMATASRIKSEIFLQGAKDEQAAAETLRMIADNNRQAELFESQRKKEEAEQAAEDARSGTSASFRQKMQAIKVAEQNYAELMADKQSAIEKYGSEDKIPPPLMAMYQQLEADLGFSLDD